MHGLIVHLSTWSTSNQTIIPHLRLISMYVFRATTGCLIGAQMRCHFLSLCGHNRLKVLFFFLNYYVCKTAVHPTQAKVEKCTRESGAGWKMERQWWGACQIHQKARDGEGEGCRDVTVIHSWMCWLLLHMDLPWNTIKITRITILCQCYFHFMFARFGFLLSMKWRSHQLLKPPLIILPRLFAAAADV